MAVKSISLASTYRGSASSSKSSISTVKSTSTQSSSSVAKTTTSKPMPSTVRPASTHSSTNAARAASSAVKPATNKITPSTAKPASTNSATNAVKAASSAVKAVANKIAPNTVKLASTHSATNAVKAASSAVKTVANKIAPSTAKPASTHSATNAVKAASSTVKPVANKIVPSTAKPASTHNTTTTVKSASSQSASNAAKATGNSIYQNSGNSLTSYPMSTNDAPSKTKVTSSKSTPSTAKTTSSKSTPSATKTSSNSANMPKPMHTHDSVSVTKAKGNSIYQNSGNSLTSYPMSTNDAPSKTKVTSNVNAKAQNTKLQQVVKGVKVTSNQVNKAYHAIDAMKPAKITKDMPLKEQFTTGLKNGGLVLVQKEKGKVDALVDTAVGTVKDTWELASNPKAAWNNLTTAIAHPKETVKAMGKAVQETVEKDYVQGNAYSRSYVEGKAILGVGTALVGTKGLGSLTKIGKVPELEKPAVVNGGNQVKEVKGTGNNSKNVGGTNKFKFVENAKNHLINVENVNTKKGIVGGHNMDEFNKALKSQGFNPNDLIVSKKPHQSIEGIYEVEYKVPRKDMAGNIAEPVSYKNIKDPKTVYDPSKISDDKIYQWGQEAMQNGKVDGRIVEGTASNGLKFRGYLNEAGEITNFFPIID
ncbi:EndoU domain-containing protein [Metasolibacillus meyeri]|uniref:EndoU domain-containing protein n=1 Tax=Metasolibacillus meyeri TaxID=1071052 RepID=UPI001EE70246|nr:EndoU domain-containing protein [Metasolibacillus meyeri]